MHGYKRILDVNIDNSLHRVWWKITPLTAPLKILISFPNPLVPHQVEPFLLALSVPLATWDHFYLSFSVPTLESLPPPPKKNNCIS